MIHHDANPQGQRGLNGIQQVDDRLTLVKIRKERATSAESRVDGYSLVIRLLWFSYILVYLNETWTLNKTRAHASHHNKI